jgi:hypothetical protein
MSNQQQKPSRGRLIAVALAAACAFGAASLAAAEGRRAEAATKPAQRTVINQVKINQDGLRVYLDPATGKVKQPTAAEVRALDQALASLPGPALKNVQAKQYSDGSIKISLDANFMNYALARINPDGSVSGACVDTAADADAFLNGNHAPALEEQ